MIQTEEEYIASLRKLIRCWGAEPGSSAEKELFKLADAIFEYEEIHYPIISKQGDRHQEET